MVNTIIYEESVGLGLRAEIKSPLSDKVTKIIEDVQIEDLEEQKREEWVDLD